MLTRNKLALLVAGGLFAVAAVPVPATQIDLAYATAAGAARTSSEGIQVTGRGEVRVQPDEVVVALRIRARDTSPIAAHAAFKERRTLFEKAMQAFEDVELKTEHQGVRIGVHVDSNNQIFVNGQMQQPDAPFETRESVHVRLPIGDDDAVNIDLISQLIQAAVDVECALDVDDSTPWNYNPMGTKTTPIRYRLTRDGLVEARNEAMRIAMEDALDQGRTLAELAGTALGPVESVTVVAPFPETLETSGAGVRSVSLAVRFGLAR